MINKDKIVFETKTYFTPTYGSPIGVRILKVFENDNVLVQAKNGTFVRPIKHVYNTQEHARKGGRAWEHDERKRRRNKKKSRRSKNAG